MLVLLRIASLLSAIMALAVLAACGGGGGGSGGEEQTQTLYVTFSYAASPSVDLRAPMTLSPTLGGLQGHAPSCSLSSGSLPPGVTLDAASCVVSGVPTVAGQYAFRVHLTSAGVSGAVDATTAILVTDPTPTLTRVVSPYGNPNLDYDLVNGTSYGPQSHVAISVYSPLQGDVLTYAVVAGSLPAGMSFHSADGSIGGTPTGYGASSASVAATLMRNGVTYTTAAVALSFEVGFSRLSVTYATLCTANVGTPVLCAPLSNSFVPMPGAALSFSAAGLPNGLVIDPATGVISGVTTNHGTQVTVSAHETLPDGSSSDSMPQVSLNLLWPAVAYMGASGNIGVVNGPFDLGNNVMQASLTAGVAFRIKVSFLISSVAGDVQSFTLLPLDASTPVPSWVAVNSTTGDIYGQAPAGSSGGVWVLQLTTTRYGVQYPYSVSWSVTVN